jgi:hypothetical protein
MIHWIGEAALKGLAGTATGNEAGGWTAEMGRRACGCRGSHCGGPAWPRLGGYVRVAAILGRRGTAVMRAAIRPSGGGRPGKGVV